MKTIFFSHEGPLVQFDGECLLIEDLNPHVQTKWRMSRWEMFAFGVKTIFAAALAR